ncbi:MAG: hypothetical protein ACKOPO_01870, partial [Novosphingobium sp.]
MAHPAPGNSRAALAAGSAADPKIVTKRTYCRICMTCCGLAVDLDETSGRIVKVKGDFDHPISKGYTCPKGRS